MTIIKQTGVQSNGHMKNLRGYINDDRKVLVRDSLNMDGCNGGRVFQMCIRDRPSTWRKRGTDLPGFPTFRQAPGQSRNPPPIEMLKTPSSRDTIGRRRGKAGHAAAAR